MSSRGKLKSAVAPNLGTHLRRRNLGRLRLRLRHRRVSAPTSRDTPPQEDPTSIRACQTRDTSEPRSTTRRKHQTPRRDQMMTWLADDVRPTSAKASKLDEHTLFHLDCYARRGKTGCSAGCSSLSSPSVPLLSSLIPREFADIPQFPRRVHGEVREHPRPRETRGAHGEVGGAEKRVLPTHPRRRG